MNGIKLELCTGAGSAACAVLGAVLHDAYFVLSFISVATGAFLGTVSVWHWLKNKKWRK